MNPARRYQHDFVPLFEEIYARWPAAVDHDPCPCGLTLAIIPRSKVRPELHYIVDDIDLRERVRAMIVSRNLGFTRWSGEDAVLVLCELA